MAFCGAVGWAFGGQMSYAIVVGYTAASSLPDVAYGYCSLFLIGALWAVIGSAILALSVTQSRSYLETSPSFYEELATITDAPIFKRCIRRTYHVTRYLGNNDCYAGC